MRSERLIYTLGVLTVIFLIAFEHVSKVKSESLMLDLPIEDIQELDINFDCDLFVNKGDASGLIIEGDRDLLKGITHQLTSGKLKLDIKNDFIGAMVSLFGFDLESEKPRIYISHNTLKKLNLTQRSNVVSSDFSFNGSQLKDRSAIKLKMDCIPQADFTSCYSSNTLLPISL